MADLRALLILRLLVTCCLLCCIAGSGISAQEVEPESDVVHKASQADIQSVSSLRIPVRGRTSASELKIEQELKEESSFEFRQTPLFGVAGLLSKRHDIQIVLDTAALAEEGVSTEEEVDIDIPKVSLSDGLNLMLKDLSLDYLIKNGVLLITTKYAAEEAFETRVYDVRGLHVDDPETLVDVLIHTTGGESWRTFGGQGDLSFFKGSFVIKQNRQTHEEIEGVLNQLLYDVASNPESPAWPARNRNNLPQYPQGGFGGGAAGVAPGGGLGGGGGGGFF